MKTLKLCLQILFLPWLFCCKDTVDPNIDLVRDGTLRIVSITFPGIDDQNVDIDQKNHIVRVKTPPLLPQAMVPKITLTDNASIWGGTRILSEMYSNGIGLFLADSVFLPLVKKNDSLSAGSPLVTYYFISEATGPLTMGELERPRDYVLYNEEWDIIWIPFSNLYGNKVPTSFKLKNRTTDEAYELKGKMVKGSGAMVNHLGVDISTISTLVPGSYELSISDSQGRIFKVTQPINVKMGSAYLEYSRLYFGHEVAAGGLLNLRGNNLFEGHITLDLTDNVGKTIKLTNLKFERTGHGIAVPIPPTLVPGQYILRMYQDGIWNDICYRVNVFKDTKKVSFIGTIGDIPTPCTLLEPIIVSKSKEIFFTYVQIEAGRPRLKLVSTANTNEIYYGEVKPHTGGVDSPTVTLPEQIKVGLYTASLEVLDGSDKVISESMPCSQLLSVK